MWQSQMNWINQNLGLVLQTSIALAGSTVAIWIALFQQRAISRRESAAIEQKQMSVSPVISRDAIELAIKVEANVLFIKQMLQANANQNEEELLIKAQVPAPPTFALNIEQAQLLGSTLSRHVVAMQFALSVFNLTKTIPDRLKAKDELFRVLRGLNKEIERRSR